MKKYWIVSLIISLLFSVPAVKAQSNQNPFFSKDGTVALQTTAMDAMADTIAVVNHRWDDVAWSKIVYRIIDMRDKQNYQLYFPVIPNDEYRSLFRLMLDAVVNDTLKAYDKVERDIRPLYNVPLNKDSLRNVFVYVTNDTVNKKILSKEQLIELDPVSNTYQVSKFLYEAFVKEQLRFLIQEIVFFDKHTSRLYTQIIGIAPIYVPTETNVSFMNLAQQTNSKVDAWQCLQSAVLCWFKFHELRPYLAKQYVIPNENSSQRLTYDEFFAQHLYSSYILGENNSRDWMLLKYLSDPEKVRKEQNRIETELLNFEQDLWEY